MNEFEKHVTQNINQLWDHMSLPMFGEFRIDVKSLASGETRIDVKSNELNTCPVHIKNMNKNSLIIYKHSTYMEEHAAMQRGVYGLVIENTIIKRRLIFKISVQYDDRGDPYNSWIHIFPNIKYVNCVFLNSDYIGAKNIIENCYIDDDDDAF